MTSKQLPDSFFKQIVDSNWVAVTFADLQGEIIYTNESANKLYGYNEHELVGKNVDVFNADNSIDTNDIVTDIVNKGRWSGEIAQKRKNGEVFPALLNVWLINDDEGKPYGLVSNSKDLTEEREVEKRIQESSVTLKLLLDSLPIGIYILDAKGNPYYANEFTKVFAKKDRSHTIESLDSTESWEVFKRNSNERYPVQELPIMQALHGKKSSVTDLDIVINGNRYSTAVNAEPVLVNGELVFAVSTFSDISEILDKQKEIETRENEIQALINSHDFYFFSVDNDFKIIRYNNAFAKTIEGFGVLAKEFNVKSIIPPQYLVSIEQFYKDAFLGKTITDIREFETSDGQMQTYETKYAPIYRGEEVSAVSVISQNITDRVKNENKLKEVLNSLARRESEISSIINNTDAMILSIDKKYNIIEYNNAFHSMVLENFGVSELKNTLLLDYLIPSSHAHVKPLYERAFRGETVVDEYGYQTSKGFSVYETRYNPIYSGGGIIAISIFSQNISSRKDSERKLKLALEEKELLLHEIHHRVKNNLAIISSLLQLEELKTSNEEIKDILVSSQNRIKSTALVHQFLYQNDSIAKINFNEYVKEFINQIEKSLTTDKQIAIVIEGEEFDLDIEHAIPCGLILNELFTNSVKHAFPNNISEAKINVCFNKQDDKVQLMFLDNGVGFDETILRGNTLGLTVVKTLVKQLRGSIVVESKKGAIFTIIFYV